jgi:hypothetical protein
MAAGISDSRQQLWVDGQSITLNYSRTTAGIPGSLVNGAVYTITSPGTTDFTLIGAPDNNVGTIFTAVISGPDPTSGSGTATTPATGTAGTCATLTWNLPKQPTTGSVAITVYDGILITSSIKETNSSNFPTDTVRYNASASLTPGSIVALDPNSIQHGINYVNGTYLAVPLVGGSGSGATVDVVVANGIVTTVTLASAGINYGIGDWLQFGDSNGAAIVPGGNGFSINVQALSPPPDMIGNAQVVGAFYNDKVTTTLYLTNLIPDVAYYFSAHACTSVYTYYTFGVQSYAQSISGAPGTYASDLPKNYGPPANPVAGQVYFDEIQKLVFVWDQISGSWEPTSPSNILTNNFDPILGQVGLPVGYPVLGDFFYNTTQRMLKCWDGAKWEPVNTSTGVPMYEKENVGSDLTYQARARMIESIKMQLGHPVVCVELMEVHFNVAIDNALQELRHRVDSAYNKEYFFLQIQQFQDIYYLNDPASGTDKIVDVLKIHRLNMLGLVNFAPDNIYAQQFLNQFYAPGVSYDLVSIHLISAMSETFEQLFAGSVAFNWREARREMQIYRKFGTPEKVLIECSCEKPEQELLQDRWVAQWIQQWAKSSCLMTLAQIRGKYATLPGPGGGLTMNASELAAEGQRLQEDCLRQIQDMEVGQNGPDNFFLPFMVG